MNKPNKRPENIKMVSHSGLISIIFPILDDKDAFDYVTDSLENEQNKGDEDDCLDGVEGRGKNTPGVFEHLPGALCKDKPLPHADDAKREEKD
jgi:hypothetical protein